MAFLFVSLNYTNGELKNKKTILNIVFLFFSILIFSVLPIYMQTSFSCKWANMLFDCIVRVATEKRELI